MADFEFDPRLRDDVLPKVETQEDRVVAIVLSAIVEDQLRTAVKSHVVDDVKAVNRMFDGVGPLASFSALIDMGQLLALYREDLAEKLHSIRRVRNKFAHDPLISSFDAPELTAIMHKLAFMEKFGRPGKSLTTRERFISASKFMLGAFAVVIRNAKALKAPETGPPLG